MAVKGLGVAEGMGEEMDDGMRGECMICFIGLEWAVQRSDKKISGSRQISKGLTE